MELTERDLQVMTLTHQPRLLIDLLKPNGKDNQNSSYANIHEA